MILHWNQLENYYGHEISAHRVHFHDPGQSTYGVLCCRWADQHTRLVASHGDHAEEQLLNSEIWRQIRNAVEQWFSHSTAESSKAIVTLALNRSPCHPRCVPKLHAALKELQYRFSRRFFNQWRFILACRGAYRGPVTASGYPGNATTVKDLARLSNAGWELCVLQTGLPVSGITFDPGDGLPPSGREFLEALMQFRHVGRPSITFLHG